MGAYDNFKLRFSFNVITRRGWFRMSGFKAIGLGLSYTKKSSALYRYF